MEASPARPYPLAPFPIAPPPAGRGGTAARNGRVTKSVILMTALPRRLALRKCPSCLGFLVLIRCGIPLSGGGGGENETSSVFCGAERPARIGFSRCGGGRIRGSNRGGKAMTRPGLDRGTSPPRSPSPIAPSPAGRGGGREVESWVVNEGVGGGLLVRSAEPGLVGRGPRQRSPQSFGTGVFGRPGLVPAPGFT
jgi:hypothetical protein